VICRDAGLKVGNIWRDNDGTYCERVLPQLVKKNTSAISCRFLRFLIIDTKYRERNGQSKAGFGSDVCLFSPLIKRIKGHFFIFLKVSVNAIDITEA